MKSDLPYRYKHPHPAVAVDLVIFTIMGDELALLLIERGAEPFRGQWALPGGFVRIDESLDVAAQRELAEETGVASAYLEQFAAFGEPKRDPRERVISIAYYAIINSDRVALKAGSDANRAEWHLLKDVASVAFDHREIVSAARLKLIEKISSSTIAVEFLAAEFTVSELQRVYEAVSGAPLDKRNFRKWADSLSFIKPTGKLRRGAQHRPAALYTVTGKSHAAFKPQRDLTALERAESVTAADAYQRGYEEAIVDLNKSMSENQKTLLRAIRSKSK